MVLVTTAITEALPSDTSEEILFLGEWCRNYKNQVVMDTCLNDREKFGRDYDYLDDFYERILISLSNSLNEYHGINNSSRYWRIVLGHWLLTYVSAVWNRWEDLRIAFDNYKFDKTYLISVSTKNRTPISHRDAFNLIDKDHLWNHKLYAKILTNSYSGNIEFVNIDVSKTKHIEKSFNNNRVYKAKYIVASFFDKLLGKVIKNQKIILVNSYFNFMSLVKISLKLRQFPRLYSEFDENIDMPEESSRSKIFLSLNCKNEFEKFVLNNIVPDIPIPYIEGYCKILERSTSLFPYCDVIFTANAHLYNELFKIWCAEKVGSGKKLIVSDHGGAIGLNHDNFSHEDKISDIHVVWHKSLNDRQVQMPPNILVGRKIKNKKSINSLSIIGVEFPLYVRRHNSGTISSLTLDDYRQKVKFIKGLSTSVIKYVKVRIKSDRNWNTRQRYADEFGIEKISIQQTLVDEYSNSKIIVCTYPQTTFLEAMHSGVPTILLYKDAFWDLRREFNDLIQVLIDANIVFSDPILASNHINKVWKSPGIWWNSVKVKSARERFCYECGYVDDSSLNKWSDFFQKQLIC